MSANRLWLKPEHTHELASLALNGKPNEICGLVVGRGFEATALVPLQNVSRTPQFRYEVDPVELSIQLPKIAKAGLDVIAIYHSHPNGDPVPSPTDIQEATWENTPYVIIGCKHHQPRLNAWTIANGRVTEVDLHIGYDYPTNHSFEMSQFQKNAVILGGIFALIAFVLLSMYLLPAAPPIP